METRRIGEKIGSTTRIVDTLVQDFFANDGCAIYDHDRTTEALTRVFNLVLNRLGQEHGIRPNTLELNTENFTITRRKS